MGSLEQRSQCAQFSHLYWVVILNITCAVSPSAARFGVHFPCTLRYAPNLCLICTNTKKSNHLLPLCITFQHYCVVYGCSLSAIHFLSPKLHFLVTVDCSRGNQRSWFFPQYYVYKKRKQQV